MEKVSRRMNELETVNNNVKLLNEMLVHYNPSSVDSEKDIMKASQLWITGSLICKIVVQISKYINLKILPTPQLNQLTNRQ